MNTAIATTIRAERWTAETASTIETGRHTVTGNDLPLFCRAFEIDLTELVGRATTADLKSLGPPRM